MLFHCDDGNAELEIEAADSEAAAQEYVDGGDWGSPLSTVWVNVTVWADDPDDAETFKVAVDPEEPECSEDEHNWTAPHDLVGGLESNPGVFGHGGGVIIVEVCSHCGLRRDTDTWAQDRQTGEQGLNSVTYSSAGE